MRQFEGDLNNAGGDHERPEQRAFHGVFRPVQNSGRKCALHRLDSRFGHRAEELILSSGDGRGCVDLLWSAHMLLDLRNLRPDMRKGDKNRSKLWSIMKPNP